MLYRFLNKGMKVEQTSGWRENLAAAAREAAFTFPSIDLILNEAHGRVAAAYPHLVRGVAGSGKTTVLAKNYARMLDRKLNSAQLDLYRTAPEKHYAIICFNRALVPLLERAVQDAFQELTYGQLPHAWRFVT